MIRRKSIIHLQQLARLTVSARGALFPEYSKEYSCAKSSSLRTCARKKKNAVRSAINPEFYREDARYEFRTSRIRYLDEKSFLNFTFPSLFFSFFLATEIYYPR